MKYLISAGLTSLILLSLAFPLAIMTSCDKEEEITQFDCIEISQNPNWTTEDFKTNYTIQFPDSYQGYGMVGFEGKIFFKNRTDDKVELTYYYCPSGLFCNPFGDTLAVVPVPNSITTRGKDGNDIILNSKQEFCLNGSIIGILYYNTEMNSTAKYYMKQGDDYLEGLIIYFTDTEYQEVENIIKSIAEN